jgi:hypothetical protein
MTPPRAPWAQLGLALLLAAAPTCAAMDSAMPAPAAAETSEVVPVWRIDVTQEGSSLTPRLVTNAFADSTRPRMFPLRDLPLVRVTSSPTSDHQTEVAVDIARLRVGKDGRIPAAPPSFFLPMTRVCVEPWTGHTTFLCETGPGAPPNRGDPAQDFFIDDLAIPGDEYRWEASREGTWGIVHATGGFALLERKRRVFSRPGQIVASAFSRDGSKYVGSRRVLGYPPREEWFVIGRDGRTLYQSEVGPSTLDHLEFDPDGRSVLLSWRRGESFRVRLESGRQERLPDGWWDDDHYYSADGRTDLRVGRTEGGPSVIRLFDCSDPTQPIPLGEPLVLDAAILWAAVSADGSLFALQESEGDVPGPMSVAVYDRRLRPRALLLKHTRRGGMLFSGAHLFVGTGPTVFFARFGHQSTTGIMDYDLSGF